jgi:hypothetical protein
LREFYKRLWIMLSEHIEDPIVWVHADGKSPIPCFSFATCNWEGEMVQGAMKGGDALLSDLLPPDFWRAHLIAKQWGIVPMWLPSTFGTGEQRLRQQNDMLALLLVHGTPFARNPNIDTETVRRIWRCQHEFGIGEAEFHGYWGNSDLVEVSPSHERILASFYRRQGRILLVLANLTDEHQQVYVQFKAPVRPTKANLCDVLDDSAVSLNADRLEVTVRSRSFRLLKDW